MDFSARTKRALGDVNIESRVDIRDNCIAKTYDKSRTTRLQISAEGERGWPHRHKRRRISRQNYGKTYTRKVTVTQNGVFFQQNLAHKRFKSYDYIGPK